MSGRSGDGEAQAVAQHSRGMGRERTEVGSSHAQSPATGVGERPLPQRYPESQEKVMLPAAPQRGWAGEAAGELKVRSCSPSLSQGDVKAGDPECDMPAEPGELCH